MSRSKCNNGFSFHLANRSHPSQQTSFPRKNQFCKLRSFNQIIRRRRVLACLSEPKTLKSSHQFFASSHHCSRDHRRSVTRSKFTFPITFTNHQGGAVWKVGVERRQEMSQDVLVVQMGKMEITSPPAPADLESKEDPTLSSSSESEQANCSPIPSDIAKATTTVEESKDLTNMVLENKNENSILNGTAVFPSPTSVNPLEPVPQFLRIVEGIDKLRRAIGKELTSRNSNEKCSNLPHLLSIAQCLLKPSSLGTGCVLGGKVPSAVLKPFNFIPKKSKKTIRFIVDIVSADGDEWSKVSARNPRSLQLLASGGGGYGQKSMLDHAKEYLYCAQQHQCFFKPPRVKFIFSSGIGAALCSRLEALGVKVEGERIPDEVLAVHPRLKPYKDLLCESSDSNSDEGKSNEQSGEDSVDGVNGELNGRIHGDGDGLQSKVVPKPAPVVLSPHIRNPSLEGITKLNLDITALLAYCSNLTNGHTNVQFKSKILTQQLEFERMRPQKPILESVFRGRELYCCEMAFKEFKTILGTVGGLQEQRRAFELLHRVKVVPDQISERSRTLAAIGSIKLRSVTIFGTGDSMKAVTVSANSGFIRSAKSQGIEYPVFLHESRALTEEKENFNSLFAYLK